MVVTDFDRRMMAAAIRYSYRHLSRTGTNPSVSTLIAREVDGEPVVVGRGLTAAGRPPARRDRSNRRSRGTGPRRNGLRLARTMRPSRQHAALRRGPDQGRRQTRPSQPPPIRTTGFPIAATACCAPPGSRWKKTCWLARGAIRACGLFDPSHQEPAACHAQTCAFRGRQDRPAAVRDRCISPTRWRHQSTTLRAPPPMRSWSASAPFWKTTLP